MKATAGQVIVNDALPRELRDYARTLDADGVKALLERVAKEHPEKYRDISHKLAQVGWRTAQERGGFTFGLQHLRKGPYATQLAAQLEQQVGKLLDDDSLDDKQREDAIIKLAGSRQKEQQDKGYEEALAAGNPLALSVLSKARGNRVNLASLISSDLLYADHRGNTIPIPILRSYSQGLRPWEAWAGAYGARKGVVDLKLSTAKAGYLSKILNQVTHRLVVEDLDHDGEPDSIRGLPVDTADPDNEGALLAHDAGGFKRNTVLTPKLLRHLAGKGIARILVRSPTVGSAPRGGVYARDVGVREHGTLPGRGEFPGMAAAQGLAEPITQAQIGSKHSGGIAGEGKSISGFDYINQLVQIPKRFKGGAAHADVDGTVGRIEDAPAGGTYVWVDGTRHFVPIGAAVQVKRGQAVEAGDTLSEGLPNPAKVVDHKGIGEGRRYFVQAFRKAMADAGQRGDRRNIELLARGLINHVRLTDETDDGVPDDVMSYATLEHRYQPRHDAADIDPSLAAGKYLEKPVLHYSIGTRVRPSVLKDLQEFGVKQISVHEQPPAFQPVMVRGMNSLSHDEDWMTKMYGAGLKGSLLKSVHRGGISDEKGTSFVPSLARAVDFGHIPGAAVRKPEPGWKPEPPFAIKAGSVPGSGDDFRTGHGQLPAKPTAPAAPKPMTGRLQLQQQPQQAAAAMSRPGGTYFSDYRPSPASGLGQAALQMAPHLGPLGPLAVMGGLDYNALQTLTRGPNRALPAAEQVATPTTVSQAAVAQARPVTPPQAPQANLPGSPVLAGHGVPGMVGETAVRVGGSTLIDRAAGIRPTPLPVPAAAVPKPWYSPSRIMESAKGVLKSPLASGGRMVGGVLRTAPAAFVADKAIDSTKATFDAANSGYGWQSTGDDLISGRQSADPLNVGTWMAGLTGKYMKNLSDATANVPGGVADAMVEGRRLRGTMQNSNVVSPEYQAANDRLRAVENRDYRAARTPDEARVWMQASDPALYHKLMQQAAAGHDVDWRTGQSRMRNADEQWRSGVMSRGGNPDDPQEIQQRVDEAELRRQQADRQYQIWQQAEAQRKTQADAEQADFDRAAGRR